MAYPPPSHASPAAAHGGVMRNHRSQAPGRPAPFARRRITITRINNPPSSATTHGRAQPLRDLVTHDIFIRQETAFYDGGVMVVDARPVSSAAEETAATPKIVNGLSKEVISRFLETTVYEKTAAADGGGDPDVCAVCQDLYQEKQMVGVLRCRHRFHADCIGEWLQIKNVCPLCNAIGISGIL